MSKSNIVEGATSAQTINMNEFSKITIISTGGSTDTVIKAGLNSTRYLTLSPITGGVGHVTITDAFNVVEITPGTSATLDIIGDTKA